MFQKFDEKFANLINHNVPRTFLRNQNTDGSDIPTQQSISETDKFPKPPSDGFIATYCCRDKK